MNSKDFGAYIRKKRKEKSMNIVDLAKRLDVSQPYLSNLENGKRGIPTPQTLRKYSEALNVPYAHVLQEAGYIEKDGNVKIDTFRDMFPPSETYTKRIKNYYDYNYLDIYDILTKTDSVLYKKNILTKSDKDLLIMLMDRAFREGGSDDQYNH